MGLFGPEHVHNKDFLAELKLIINRLKAGEDVYNKIKSDHDGTCRS